MGRKAVKTRKEEAKMKRKTPEKSEEPETRVESAVAADTLPAKTQVSEVPVAEKEMTSKAWKNV
jgi:hypothetical protein